MGPDARTRPLQRSARRRAGVTTWWSAGLVAGVLLVVLGLFGAPPTVDASAARQHHADATRAGELVPFTFGAWVGADVPVPTSAEDLLKPNVLISRAYENMDTGESVSLLIVQCTDARDLAGHYPPVCYPAHGLEPGTAVAMNWRIAGHEIPAMRYSFSEQDVTSRSVTVVDNFMALPTGRFGRDMDEMRRVGKDRRLRHFGAAQVQLLTSGAMSDQRRDEVFEEVVGVVVPLIEPFLGKVENR